MKWDTIEKLVIAALTLVFIHFAMAVLIVIDSIANQ